MNDKSKKIVGVLGVFALVVLVGMSIQNGGMKGLNGRDLVDIEPAAGEVTDTEPSHGDHDHEHRDFDWGYDVPPEPTECGIYEHWVANPVDEDAVKDTGKVYRIIGLGDAVTMDHNPERINVYINADGIVLDVKCG